MTEAGKRLQRALALHRTLIKTKLEIEQAIQELREEMRRGTDEIAREEAVEHQAGMAAAR